MKYYLRVLERYQRGEIILLVHEKTLIQALQRKFPAPGTKPRSMSRVEHEYIRYGT